jgi:DNA-binding response OmpR family regulator
MRGDEAVHMFTELAPQVVLLDINLPGKDGLTVLQELREISHVPILMLSARDDQDNISASFEFQADDYIGKPFSPREVIMRIKAILRRGTTQAIPKGLVYKDLRFIESELRVIRANKSIVLTKSEFQILTYIINHAGKIVSREDLMKEIMGYSNFLYDRTIDTHIKNIRHKVGDDVLITVRGIGYKSF